jgi:hypothetical protein
LFQLSRRSIATLVSVSLSGALLAIAGCGDDSESDPPEASKLTTSQAIAEIAEVRTGLAQSLAAYRGGNANRAGELATDTYLEHFELVEPPLEEVDPGLKEELEELIREQLRAKIDAGAPVAEISRIVMEANGALNQAETALAAGEDATVSEDEGGAY